MSKFDWSLVLKKAIIVIACVSILAVLLFFALQVYPVVSGDSYFFLEPAVQFARNSTLTNHLFINQWEMDTVIDPTGMDRFLYYPPLYPMLVGSLLGDSLPQNFFIVLAVVNSFVLILSALLFYKCVTSFHSKKLKWVHVIMILIGLFALVSSFSVENGRPEILARLWLVLGALTPFYFRGRISFVLYGIILGLMFATHPMGGVLSLLILGVIFSLYMRTREVCLRLGIISLIGVCVTFLLILGGPYGLLETVRGTVLHGQLINQGIMAQFNEWISLLYILQYFFFSPSTPFYGFVVILLVVVGIYFYSRVKSKILSRFFFFLCVGILSLLFIQMLVGHVLYLSLLAPLIFAGFILFALEKGTVWKGVVSVVFLLVTTGFVRNVLIFPSFFYEGVSFEEAGERFRSILEKEDPDLIGVTSAFWVFSEDYERMYVYTSREIPKKGTDLIFFQQRYSGLKRAPDIKGCNVIEDRFSLLEPMFLGVKLGNTPSGYQYAVYKCGIS